MLSLQITDNGEPLGALTLYSRTPAAFDDTHDVNLALLYTIHATNALVASRLIDGLHSALGSRHVIGLAQGRLMEKYGVAADQAFSILTRFSTTTNRKLRDIAGDIAATGVVEGLEPSGGPA